MRVAPGRHCWPASSGLLAAYAGSAAVTAVVTLAGGTRHPAMLGSHIRRAGQGPLPAPDPAAAVDPDEGIPDGHPEPAARAPAAAATAVTTAASNEPDDDGVLIGHPRLAA